jgi:gamma-glutamyltranspeptidase
MKPMSHLSTIDNNNMQNTIAATTGFSYGSGLAGLVTGLTLNDWLAIGSFVFMALTYLTNLYFRLKAEKREIELYEQRKRCSK